MNNGKLGEVTKETRTLRTHLNGYYPTETAVMEYRSDYLGRMQHIVYPDGEKVTYGYDQGGQVTSVTGENFGQSFEYVKDIGYDEYGQRVYIEYGNGVKTEYKYDPARRWLDTIKTENKWGQSYQNISYSFDAVGNVLGYENNCLDNVAGNYKTSQTYSYDNLYQLIRVEGETTYDPYRSDMPEYKSNYSQTFTFDELGLGNMASKVSKESVRPNKKIGDNLNYNFTYVYDENFAHRLVRAGDRYYKYDANGNIICEQDGSFESNGNDTAYHKIEQETEDVYSTDYGWGLFKEDKTGSTTSRYRRTYTWNERNQLISSVDANYSTAYVYGQDGQRSNKYTGNSETLYFNKMWTHHTDSGNSIYGGQTSKNIYLGETRIVTKLNAGTEPTYQEEYYKQYYYHSDHLGSASMISDYKGDEYQRIEYTPYGETWVEKTSNTGLEYLPYKFTAKELDEETGLYYYGARYLDPRYSMWLSTDPALGEYIPKAPVNEEAKQHNQNLPGLGGVFNTVNLNLYHYAANNPIRYIDPDGRFDKDTVRGIVRKVGANPVAVTAAQKGIFPNEIVGFTFDSSTSLYHTTFDCWQGSLFNGFIGYNKLYDVAFDIGTSMKAVRFDFSSGGTDYTLWGWKGDYLNLGAGCELGIYEKASGALGSLDHFVVNKDLAMNMSATLTLNGKTVGSFNGTHWWATSFNPNVQNVKAEDLTAQFTVNFGDNKRMYSDFKNRYEFNKFWSFNDETNTATLIF